jgi:putative MATE family efflux protein
LTSPKTDLTEGTLTAALFRLAAPMLASAVLQNVQSLIDLLWVRKLGSVAVAGIGLGGTVLMMLFPIIIGSAAGTVAMVSRAVGAGRNKEACDIAGCAMMLALVLGAGTGALGWLAAPKLCAMMGVKPAVAETGTAYLEIAFAGSFTVFLLFAANSALQGAGNSIVPMCAMLFANTVNIILDPILIFGLFGMPRMEVQGAALATVLAQLAAVFALVITLRKGVAGVRVQGAQWRLRLGLVGRLFKLGCPGSGQMLSRSLMALVLMRIVAACGTTTAVAAYVIALRLQMIVLMPAFSLGNASAAIVGQNLGAFKPNRAGNAAWLATAIDAGIMLLSTALICIFTIPIMRAFTSDPGVVAIGVEYFRTVSPFYVFIAASIVLGRSLQGAGDMIASMFITIFCLWGLQIPLAFLWSRSWNFSTQGIWWAIAVATTAHGVLVTAWFMTGRWKSKEV